MRTDAIKTLFALGMTAFIQFSGFYALVLNQYVLDDLVKGAIIGMMTGSLAWLYGDQTASRTAARQQKAFDSGLGATPNAPGAPVDPTP